MDGGGSRLTAGRRARQITLMVQSAVTIPWECSFSADPMRTSGTEMLTPGPRCRFISKNASFLPISLFVFPIHHKYDFLFLCTFFSWEQEILLLETSRKGKWRMISQLYIEGLSLGHYLIWKHIIIIGNRNLCCFYEQRGRQ